MKKNLKMTLALAGLLALGTTALIAQPLDNGGAQDGPGPGGLPMRGHHPPVPAIVRALDVNHDGVIESNEIANASAELKTLDKNGDGKLTPDEFMGPRPRRSGGFGRGPAGNCSAGNYTRPSCPPPGDGSGNPTPASPPPGSE